MNITGIDHVVMTVSDIAETIRFYESVLGMVAETYRDGRVSLKFGRQKINLHQQGREFDPKATRPVPGSADLCFLTDTAVEDAVRHVKSKGVRIIEGPVPRAGAAGPMMSFYFRDPDGNLIEVANFA